jgi:beta-glucanase (GH16 family)
MLMMQWLVMSVAVLGLAAFAVSAETRAGDVPRTLEGHEFLTSPGEGWQLVWHDEFEGEELDRSKWDARLPWGGTDGTGRHHKNDYASYIMDHNIELGDGTLKLLTRREDVTAANGRVFNYTQSMMTTSRQFRHKYGYWEVRAKLPAKAGPGLWPAFWTLADGWPPEMDILEVWTSSNRSHQGMCYRREDGGIGWDSLNTHTPLPTGWTTYGMEWGPGYQIYNINGEVTKRIYGAHVTDVPHYILLNSGVESGSPPTAATVFPNAFEVDYVRVYARPEVPTVHNGSFEDDELRPWGRSRYAAAVAYGARRGDRALRVDGGPSTSEQRVFGLKPETTYVLRGWVRLLTDEGEARLGVKEHGGEEMYEIGRSGEYEELAVRFTTGAEATTAIIYCFVPSGRGAALFDDISISEE